MPLQTVSSSKYRRKVDLSRSAIIAGRSARNVLHMSAATVAIRESIIILARSASTCERRRSGRRLECTRSHLLKRILLISRPLRKSRAVCCHHGGKCSCSIIKRETGDAAAPHGPAVKPRLEKTTSDGAITHFVNGHHKPVHRKNNAAHEHGMPYRMPVPRSNSEHSSDNGSAQSTESLPLQNLPIQEETWLPLTSAPYNAGRRRSKSEQASPRLNPSQPFLGGLPDFSTPPLDFSSLTPMRTNESAYSGTSSNMEFPPFDQMSGFSEDSLDPWTDMSALDTVTVKPNQSQHQNSLQAWSSCSPDAMYQPDLTAPSSGAQSESDDMASVGSIYGISMPSYQEPSGFNMDMGNPESPQTNRHSLPPGFFGNADFTHGGMSNEWQTAVANSAAAHQGNLSASPLSMEGAWSQMGRGGITNSPASFESSPIGSRPQSRSLGPSSAPTNDALRELFPDMDLDNIPNLTQSQPQLATRKTFNGMASSMPTSIPTSVPAIFDQQPLQASPEGSMTSQPWNDGSYTVPQDDYTRAVSYDSDTGYTSQPYTPPDWSR